MTIFKHTLVTLCLFSLLSVVFAFQATAADNPYNLAPGARGKLCLDCHEGFKGTMEKKFIHTPLAEGQCTGCHNPHAADHGKLLAADPTQICASCHEDMSAANVRSAHQVVSDGDCVTCHDPHSSDNRMNLVASGSELCFGCHEELGQQVASNKFAHSPVKQDCMTCHAPHFSAENPALLRSQAPELCLDCHDSSKKTFKSQHVGYPVETANCSSCHNPHGSNTTAMLYDNVHQPLTSRMCKQCHEDPSSATPFATVKPSFELCQGCHYEMVNDTFNKDRMHWPVVDEKGCLNCHSPHASSEAMLMKAPQKEVCSSCHSDTIARQARALTKHQPIDDGECSSCHSPHSSDNPFILTEKSNINLCGQCHDWQTHSTHPIGDDVIDPRNPNLSLDCLSCHRTHGTEYKHFIYTETINDLCVQCHQQYRR
ncbi:doubled CXXCH domain-containing protein [Malonomonas rubra DSM 5091]|uniref:Doubled CXXCH domain-containing protein n=1 Tax=Malonomonas rubra DSM 5091 TaxID=1122189 RepID=A0A1M6HYT4_MALRU|nr:cytochrome c3 family protein [Malonomonas rubra]SHJ27358.1 doubled CXXCH domain-containing protein [Malonomonas rubra DSM 5091]